MTDRALAHIAGRFIERLALAAPDLETAIRVVRDRVPWWGGMGSGWHFEARADGIHVFQTPTGHEGRVSYRSVAETARRGAVAPMQMRMELGV